MLVDSECCIEDSFVTKNARFAVQCVAGSELVVLRHCDLRPARGGKLFSVIDFEPAEDGVKSGKNIYTQMCITDVATDDELRQFPWHTAPRGNMSKHSSQNSFDEPRLPQPAVPSYDQVALDCDYFEDYSIPEGAPSSSKKRVRV